MSTPGRRKSAMQDGKSSSSTRCRKLVAHNIRTVLRRACSIMRVVFGGEASEQPKVVWRINRRKAMFHCWIHLLPVSAIIALASLNLKSCFVGDTYLGDPRPSMQELDVLGLQVSAKLLELLISSSLGLTIRDILRFVLTRSNDGLPLGMITAEISFTEMKYFFSRRFWRGVKGLSKHWQRWFVTIWIIVCGVIVALSGPSTAVLVLPTMRPVWPAGAAFFHAVGNSSTLFPLTLNNENESGGGPLCHSPSTTIVESPLSDYLGCPWAGYSTLLSVYTQWGSDLFEYPNIPITFYEWQQPRQIIQHIRALGNAPENWATVTQPAINIWSGSLDLAWRTAIAMVKTPSPAANFKFGSGGTTHIPTMLPAVRTVCYYQNRSLQVTNLSFPLLEPFETWSGKLFVLPKNDLPNATSSDTGAQWIPVPTTQVFTTNGDAVKVYASALLVSQLPQSKNGIPASTMTCSIDARWAPGESISKGTLVPVLDPVHLRVPSAQGQGYNEAAGFLPKDDGSWQLISLDPEWLQTLTPIIERSGRNQTTLVALFEVIGLINGTGGIPNIDVVYDVAANAIATLVADGISRIGMHYQDGNPAINICYIDPQNHSAFFSGDQQNPLYTYPPPVGVSAANQTQMRWYITISGLSYKADSPASQLALALLFIYTAMVLAHIAWIISTGYSSEAWNSLAELMVLAKNSPPAQGNLANTCAGIEAGSTWTKRARIRVVGNQTPNIKEEELHLLIDEIDNGYEKLESDVAYGQTRSNKAVTV